MLPKNEKGGGEDKCQRKTAPMGLSRQVGLFQDYFNSKQDCYNHGEKLNSTLLK